MRSNTVALALCVPLVLACGGKNKGETDADADASDLFGLGSETTIDSLTVGWVGGSTESIAGLVPNGRYHVVQGSGTGTLIPLAAAH